jgi:glycosyltransferase involved in cell wall biosynthesis
MKPRILWCNECSVLKTGYATYGHEVLTRLNATDKYILAEHASYVDHTDSRIQNLPWAVYANLPDPKNEREKEIYSQAPANQFGEWRFEEICLDMMPHIVMDIRDFWMMNHEYRSPFRCRYHWVIMPTVDAYPQNEEWLSTYADADGVFTYQDWSKQVLDYEGGGKINTLGSASPAAAPEFRPMANVKAEMGLGEYKIIGTVMRNQRRKLFPDLFASFAMTLQELEDKNVLLYCHTSYPDMGWDLPKLLLTYDIASKVLFTHKCRKCNNIFPDFFHDVLTMCPRCGNIAASLVSVQDGANNEEMAKIYNIFDVYVQYANSEGFGMPQLEAAACGVPIISVDYSAMSDAARKLQGTLIPPITLTSELETGCFRAVPNNDKFIEALLQFLKLDQKEIFELRQKTFQAYKKNYSWDETAYKWENYFDQVDIDYYEKMWRQPPQYIEIPNEIPEHLSNKDFARWLMATFIQEPRFMNSYMEARLIRDLNYNVTAPGVAGMYYNDDSASPLFSKMHWTQFDKKTAFDHFAALATRKNRWEQQRWQSIQK